jgi:hypothetical protein
MSKLRVHNFSISLDGYGAGPNQDLDNPLGAVGIARHNCAGVLADHAARPPRRRELRLFILRPARHNAAKPSRQFNEVFIALQVITKRRKI